MSGQQDLEGVRLVWHTNWFDGPLNGTALYQGRLHWFDATDLVGDDTFVYELFPLTDAEIAELEARHDLFRRHVGHHCDWDAETGLRIWQPRQPKEEWHHFYDRREEFAASEIYHTDRAPIGRFRIDWGERVVAAAKAKDERKERQ